MVRRQSTPVLFLAIAAMALASGRSAYGVNPNPLQSAYYRFEEAWVADKGIPATPLPPPNPPAGPGSFQPAVADANVAAFAPGTQEVDANSNPIPNTQATIPNTVKDSINANHLQAFDTNTAPKYVNYSLPPTNLKSDAPNLMAWEVDGGPGGGRDVYTINRQIQNGIVGGMYDTNGTTAGGEIVASTTTGFTLEAAFSVFDFSSFRAIIAKEGRPGLAMGSGDQNLPTMALKVRGAQFEGDPDQGKLQIELFDGAGNLKSVTTDAALTAGGWYYAAVVNDGETLSLYLDSNDGQGYELVGTQSVDGALFQGVNHDNADWNHNWTIGRAIYGGASNNMGGLPADWFNGLIDEVRLTNEALDPSEFLFATGLDGDFNDDDVVDGQDFLLWQRGESPNSVSSGDLADWRNNFGAGGVTAAAGAVPEPAALSLVGMALSAALLICRRRP